MSLSETMMLVDSVYLKMVLGLQSEKKSLRSQRCRLNFNSELIFFIFSFVYPTTSNYFITAGTKRKLTLLHGFELRAFCIKLQKESGSER